MDSRTRRVMSMAVWPPKSRTTTVSCSVAGASPEGAVLLGKGEPLPTVVNQDARGVTLFCDKAHKHDWGDYDAKPPFMA